MVVGPLRLVQFCEAVAWKSGLVAAVDAGRFLVGSLVTDVEPSATLAARSTGVCTQSTSTLGLRQPEQIVVSDLSASSLAILSTEDGRLVGGCLLGLACEAS